MFKRNTKCNQQIYLIVMRENLIIHYSSTYKNAFLLFTATFLILYVVTNQSIVFLLIFITLLCVYFRYVEGPLLVFENGIIYHNSFFQKNFALSSVVDIEVNNKRITFRTKEEQFSIKLRVLDQKDKERLCQYRCQIIELKHLKQTTSQLF